MARVIVLDDGNNYYSGGGDTKDLKIYGRGGNDILHGSAHNDTIWGETGDDLISGGSGGNDTLYGGKGDDTLRGGDGNDTLDGGLDDDTLEGEDGDDFLIGRNGDDVIDGGNGTDTARYYSDFDDYELSYDANTAQLIIKDLEGSDGTDYLRDIEILRFNNTTDYQVSYHADRHADIIVARWGTHKDLDGDSGSQTFFGGNFSNWINGRNGDDTIYAGGGNDEIYGGKDNDEIYGEDGDDYIDGGSNSDTLMGGLGDDTIYGGDGESDLAIYNGALSDYEISWMNNVYTLSGPDGTDTVAQVEYFKFDSGVYSELTASSANVSNNLTDFMNATATQSSTHSRHVAGEDAGRVLDNDSTTHNHTGDRNGWLLIDLNSDVLIEEVFIENSTWSSSVMDRLIGATVEVLDDGNVVWTSDELTRDQYQNIAVDGGVVGDQVRINNDHYIHLKEVDVFGDINLTEVMDVTATQSSTHSAPYGAENILDGNLSTLNHTANGGGAAWVMLDLDRDALIEDIMIHNRNDKSWIADRLSGAKIEVMDDGKVIWTSNELTGDYQQRIDVGGVVGDAIKISHDNFIHLREVDVFGDLLNDANITDVLNATATQSSTHSEPYGAENVLDGDSSTLNHTAGGDSAAWLKIDLGEDAWIKQIVIENRDDKSWIANRLNGATVEVLNDGAVVWSDELTGDYDQTIDVGGVTGDEVLISNDNYIHVVEVDVFGGIY